MDSFVQDIELCRGLIRRNKWRICINLYIRTLYTNLYIQTQEALIILYCKYHYRKLIGNIFLSNQKMFVKCRKFLRKVVAESRKRFFLAGREFIEF